MAAVKTSLVFLLGFFLQSLIATNAKPLDFGYGGPGFGGGNGGCGCPPPICPPICPPTCPPISFTTVPQPYPIKIPVAKPAQSVTIPNIILALLPPTNKPPVVKPCCPPPATPQPITIPIPQPYPVTIPDCGCA